MAKHSDISALDDHLGYWLRYVSNHVSHAFKLRVEAAGVTVAEWVVLRELFDESSVSPSQLASRIGMTRGAVSKLVQRLVGKRLVLRSDSEADRRYQSISLTTAGRKLIPRLAAHADQNDAQFFGHLSTHQQAELKRLLQEIVARHGWKDLPLA